MDTQLLTAPADAGLGTSTETEDAHGDTDVHVESTLGALSSQLSGALSGLAKLQDEVRIRMQAVTDMQMVAARREAEAATASHEVAERQARIADLEAELTQRRSELDARSRELDVRAADIGRATEHITAKAEESSRTEAVLTNLKFELDRRAETVSAAETAIIDTLRSVEARERDLQIRADTLGREKVELATRRTALEEMDAALAAQKSELTNSVQRTEAIRHELADRESQVRIREEAVAAFLQMLARMHHALSEVTDDTLRAAARAASDARAALERQLAKEPQRPAVVPAPMDVWTSPGSVDG